MSQHVRSTHYLISQAFLLVFCSLLSASPPDSAQIETDSPSEIRDIRITGMGNSTVDLEIEYYYNGAPEPMVALYIEYARMDSKEKMIFRKDITYVSKGHGKQNYRIDRPMLNPAGDESYSVRVFLASRRTGETIAERQHDKPVTWGSTVPESVSDSLDFILQQAKMTFHTGDYAALDAMIDGWNDPAVRNRDGKWKLDALLWFHGDTNYDYAERTLARQKEWGAQNPHSDGAAITSAMFWNGYAWHARGGGYANSVTETGWQLFRERLQKAERILLDSRSYASDNPVWYYVYINVALGLGWDKQQILDLYREAAGKEPQFYWNSFAAARAALPKWGGNRELMDQVARLAAEFSSATDGDILYTRTYWYISNDLDKDLFSDTLVSWPRMRSGFRELLDRYPDSDRNLNFFAAFACRAGDRDTYLELMHAIGDDRILESAWKKDYTRDACNRRFFSITGISAADHVAYARRAR